MFTPMQSVRRARPGSTATLPSLVPASYTAIGLYDSPPGWELPRQIHSPAKRHHRCRPPGFVASGTSVNPGSSLEVRKRPPAYRSCCSQLAASILGRLWHPESAATCSAGPPQTIPESAALPQTQSGPTRKIRPWVRDEALDKGSCLHHGPANSRSALAFVVIMKRAPVASSAFNRSSDVSSLEKVSLHSRIEREQQQPRGNPGKALQIRRMCNSP